MRAILMLDHSCQAQRHSHAERRHDLYETPSVAVEALLRVLVLPSGAIWEPACGRGAIANVLRAHGYRVVCTDLIDYGTDPTAIYGVDFLKTTELPAGISCIVTNPPYGWEGRKASSGLAFAWFVWERGYRGHPITQRISWEDGRDAVPVLLPHGHPPKVQIGR